MQKDHTLKLYLYNSAYIFLYFIYIVMVDCWRCYADVTLILHSKPEATSEMSASTLQQNRMQQHAAMGIEKKI